MILACVPLHKNIKQNKIKGILIGTCVLYFVLGRGGGGILNVKFTFVIIKRLGVNIYNSYSCKAFSGQILALENLK